MTPTRKTRRNHGKPTQNHRRDYADFCREWGLGVTICLAAATINGPMVTVSDRRLTWDSYGTATDDNAALKTALIAKTWGVMFSGADMRSFGALLADISGRLQAVEGKLTSAAVREAVTETYRTSFREQFHAEKLSRYGFNSMEHFRRDGLTVFGPELMAKFSKEIDEYDFGADLLVYGFAEGPPHGDSHIFTVENPGIVRDCNMIGYGIVGSGHDAALSSILRKPFKRPTLSEAIWRLCDAKFSAETVVAVGKETTIIILCEDGKPIQMPSGKIEAIRRAWEAERKVKVPVDASKVVKEQISQYFSNISSENI